MSNNKQIEHGDVFDIEQTVNGVSTFLWFNNKWYYFKEERFSYLDEYEYDQNDLTNLILNDEFEEVTFIKNIFNNEQQTDEKGQPLTYWGGLADSKIIHKSDRTCTNNCKVVCGECQLPSDILKNVISYQSDWIEEPLNCFGEDFGQDCEAVKNWDSFVEQKNIQLEVNKLAEEVYGKGVKEDYEEGFVDGYNKAKKTLYTKEQLMEVIELARLIDYNDSNDYYMSEDEIIKALKP